MNRTSNSTPPQRAQLVRLIHEGYDKKTWHGPNLKGTIRRVTPKQAIWRTGPGRKNIAEIVVHCAYWKYVVRRRIRGDKRGSFPLKGSNWFTIPSPLTKDGWRDLAALLAGEHKSLLSAVEFSPWSRLIDGPGGGPRQAAYHVYGVAMHDVYHAGQIQTIKALYKQNHG